MLDIWYIINEDLTYPLLGEILKGLDTHRKLIFTDKGTYNRYGQQMIVAAGPFNQAGFTTYQVLKPLCCDWNKATIGIPTEVFEYKLPQ